MSENKSEGAYRTSGRARETVKVFVLKVDEFRAVQAEAEVNQWLSEHPGIQIQRVEQSVGRDPGPGVTHFLLIITIFYRLAE